MSYRTAKIVAILLGIALAAAAVVAVLAYTAANNAVADNIVIDRRVTRIERPTPKEFDAKTLAQLKRCIATPSCRALLVATAPKGSPGDRGPRGFRGRAGRDGKDGHPATGPQGPPGRPGKTVRGPQGRPGADGRDVAPVDTSGFDRRIAALETKVGTLGCNLKRLLGGTC
jgi:hypothetical protein